MNRLMWNVGRCFFFLNRLFRAVKYFYLTIQVFFDYIKNAIARYNINVNLGRKFSGYFQRSIWSLRVVNNLLVWKGLTKANIKFLMALIIWTVAKSSQSKNWAIQLIHSAIRQYPHVIYTLLLQWWDIYNSNNWNWTKKIKTKFLWL